MRRKIITILILFAGLLVLAWVFHDKIPFLRDFFHEEGLGTQYTCPMHPQIVREKPGTCPICGMKLIPVKTEKAKPEQKHPEGTFFLSPERRQIIGVRTVPAEVKEVKREIRLPGRVAYDEELYVTEQEYVNGLIAGVETEVLKTIESKLIRLGISGEELEKLRQTKKADISLYLPKDKSSFWVYVNVTESDLSWVEKKMKAEIYLPKDGGLFLEGEVKQVAPVIDHHTRTAMARVFISNPKVSLRPETYVDVVLKKDLGKMLAIPAEAVIETGVKQIVLVDLGEGTIEPREVRLGVKAGKNYPILEGLKENEVVITSAHFLLDSEAELQATIKKFGGHRH